MFRLSFNQRVALVVVMFSAACGLIAFGAFGALLLTGYWSPEDSPPVLVAAPEGPEGPGESNAGRSIEVVVPKSAPVSEHGTYPLFLPPTDRRPGAIGPDDVRLR